MSDTETFEGLLAQTVEDIEAPKPLATGTWLLKAMGATYKEAGENSKEMVIFIYTPVEPQEDVELEGVDPADWQGTKIFYRFYVDSKQDVFNLRRMLEKHGIDMSGGVTVGDALKAVGKDKPSIFAVVGIRTYTNNVGEVVADNTLKGFAPVE